MASELAPGWELAPSALSYALAAPGEQQARLAALSRLVCAAETALQWWHAPAPLPPSSDPFTAQLVAAARPRRTWLCCDPAQAARLAAVPAAPLRCSAELPAGPEPRLRGEHRSYLELEDGRRAAVVLLTRWPPRLAGDWLAELTADPGLLATAVHLQPVPSGRALRLLRHRLAALLSSRAVGESAGQPPDPELVAASGAAEHLSRQLAAGETAVLRTQVLFVVAGVDLAQLAEAVGRLRRSAAALLATVSVAHFEQAPGWRAAQPGGSALSWPWRLLAAEAVAATVPHPAGTAGRSGRGLLAGIDPATGTPLTVARFALGNPTRVVVGTSGAGKSFAAKLEAIRWHAGGGDVVIVDPEGEFGPVVTSLGGAVLQPGAAGGLGPVGVAADPAVHPGDALTLLASVASALSAEPLTAADLALLDQALTRLRQRPGGAALAGPDELCTAVAAGARRRPFTHSTLPARLTPLTSGTLAAVFAGNPLLAQPPRALAVDLRDVPVRARAAATACLLGWAWIWARGPARPRLLVVDEAHLLLADRASAELLAGFARRCRKYRTALDVLTQRLSDFLDRPAGAALLANAATILLLGCAEAERDIVAAGLHLSAAEADLLRPGVPGRGLLLCGDEHHPLQVVASPAEAELAASGPRP